MSENTLEYYSKGMNFQEAVEKKCHKCGFEYVHITKIVVNAGGVITIVDSSGTKVVKGEPTGRGTSIWTYYYCEEGHVWCERIQFHEGITCQIIEESLDVPTDERGRFDFSKDVGFCATDDIWRD